MKPNRRLSVNQLKFHSSMKDKNYYSLEYTEPDDNKERKEFKFRSWSEFVTNLEMRVKRGTNYSNQHSSSNRYEAEFHSHRTLEDAIDEIKTEKSLSHSKTNEVYETVKNHIKLKISDEPLAGVDVPAYLSGAPECFESFVPRKVKVRKKSVQTIFITVDISCLKSSKELSKYLSEVMEKVYRNFNFQKLVISIVAKWHNDENFQLYIDIPFKDAAYILRTGFADFFRRIGFVFLEQHHDLPYGYGQSFSSDISGLKQYVGKDSVLVTFDHREEVQGVKV